MLYISVVPIYLCVAIRDCFCAIIIDGLLIYNVMSLVSSLAVTVVAVQRKGLDVTSI